MDIETRDTDADGSIDGDTSPRLLCFIVFRAVRTISVFCGILADLFGLGHTRSCLLVEIVVVEAGGAVSVLVGHTVSVNAEPIECPGVSGSAFLTDIKSSTSAPGIHARSVHQLEV